MKDKYGVEIEECNAIVTDYSLYLHNGFALTLTIGLKYGDGFECQCFGDWVLQSANKKEYLSPAGFYIKRVMEICGAENIEDIVGKYIRVKHTSNKVYAIGNIIDDDWFNPVEDLFNKIRDNKDE